MTLKVLAYRVLEDSINFAAGYLAKPIRIWTIGLDGVVAEVSENDARSIIDTCEAWRELERDALGRLLAPSLEEVDTEVPLPG